MPPTRGHDLKLQGHPRPERGSRDAPHTGARLETLNNYNKWMMLDAMPPTRGHDLKLRSQHGHTILPFDAPHTGARLETSGCLHSLLTGM